MIVVLAEKPSVARDLARVLGCSRKQDGYFEGQGYQVTWALGHLVTLKEPGDYDTRYKRWRLEDLPVVPPRFELKVINEPRVRRQFAVVRRLCRAANEVIGATDAGREGELIFRNTLLLAGCGRKPLKRLWLNSLTPAAIRQGLANLRPGHAFDRLYEAARSRSEADWIVGLNATRSFTLRFGGRQRLWSVGRVQTPVLAMIVARDDEIRRFVPEPFWELFTTYRKTVFRFAGKRFPNEAEASELCARIMGKPFLITAVQTKRRALQPPQLYDLTDLQRDMNRRFGMAAAETLAAAQQLYERKAITYPRTDSRYLSSDMKAEVPGILKQLRRQKPQEIDALDLGHLPFSKRLVDDSKVTDHHAIIPTGAPATGGGRTEHVYDAVVTRLIAALYPPCKQDVTRVRGHSEDIPFAARGVVIVDPGWTALYPKRRARRPDAGENPEEPELPSFDEGESGPHEPMVKDGMTTPPKPYTENTLLAAMETAGRQVADDDLREALRERGLGTPATRAGIIETLLSRRYIERQRKNLLATDAGRFLIAVVGAPSLKSPKLTGEWEQKLKQIEGGRFPHERFLQEIISFTETIVAAQPADSVDPERWGDCPQCGRPVIEGRRGYGCSGWRDGCGFVLWPDFDDARLPPEDIRQLLQRRVIDRPMVLNGCSVTVAMNDHGELLALPVEDTASGPRRGRHSGRGSRTVARPRTSRGTADTPLGPCPVCGAPVTASAKAYGCSAWRDGCQFTIWRRISGKTISRRTAESLLKRGIAGPLKGFKTRAGKEFRAKLRLVAGKVEIDGGRASD